MVRLPRGTDRYARGIVNAFMERMRPFEKHMPPYPIQNARTGEMGQAAQNSTARSSCRYERGRLQRCHARCPQRNW